MEINNPKKDKFVKINHKENVNLDNLIQHKAPIRAITPLLGRSGKNVVNVFRPPSSNEMRQADL
jgi:hypothetical protein